MGDGSGGRVFAATSAGDSMRDTIHQAPPAAMITTISTVTRTLVLLDMGLRPFSTGHASRGRDATECGDTAILYTS
jgi:hypothetical protein